jgi:hypothetical protein
VLAFVQIEKNCCRSRQLVITWFPVEVILRNEPKLSGADLSLTVADLHHHGPIRRDAVEPIACHTVWRPEVDHHGFAIAFFLATISRWLPWSERTTMSVLTLYIQNGGAPRHALPNRSGEKLHSVVHCPF